MQGKWTEPGAEPTLKDMLSDPVFELLLKRDRLKSEDVIRTMKQGHARMKRRTSLQKTLPKKHLAERSCF